MRADLNRPVTVIHHVEPQLHEGFIDFEYA